MKWSERCVATTLKGTRCKKKRREGLECCANHARQEVITCAICMTPTNDTHILANCEHTFCKNCIFEWLTTKENKAFKSSCPLCREPVYHSDVFWAERWGMETGKFITLFYKQYHYRPMYEEMIEKTIEYSDIDTVFTKLEFIAEMMKRVGLGFYKWLDSFNTDQLNKILQDNYMKLCKTDDPYDIPYTHRSVMVEPTEFPLCSVNGVSKFVF